MVSRHGTHARDTGLRMAVGGNFETVPRGSRRAVPIGLIGLIFGRVFIVVTGTALGDIRGRPRCCRRGHPSLDSIPAWKPAARPHRSPALRMKPHPLLSPVGARALALAVLALARIVIPAAHGSDSANWVDANQTARPPPATSAPSPVTAVDWWTQFGDSIETRAARTDRAAKAQIPHSTRSVMMRCSPRFRGSAARIRRGAPGTDAAWELDTFRSTRPSNRPSKYKAAIETRRDTLSMAEVGSLRGFCQQLLAKCA